MSSTLAPLVADLFAIIQLLSGYPPPTIPPDVHRVSQTEIQQRFCHGSACKLKAAYDPRFGVYIDETLDIENDFFSRSILLHELVHHVQSVSGRYDYGDSECVRRNSAEQEAYRIQNQYLVAMNTASRVSMTGWASRCDEAIVPTPKAREQ